MDAKEMLLEVDGLSVAFDLYEGALKRRELTVIRDLSVSLEAGEILAIVGSSGSGKSLLAHAIFGLLPENARVGGEIRYLGQRLDGAALQKLRGTEIALVPQSVGYLDPLMRVEKQVLGAGARAKRRLPQLKAVFQRMELEDGVRRQFPFQLSGGIARRVLFSTAIVSQARLIVADEPTPGMALHQAMEALRAFRELADEGKGVLLITHDVDLALNFADKIAVFYAGTVLELAAAADFLGDGGALRHPYSRALHRAMPQNGFAPLPGFQPYAGDMPPGCPFAPRCPQARARCAREAPEMAPLRGGFARCFYAS